MEDLPVNVILLGDSREILRTLPDASVDSVVTDPPAGIGFMGKDWDDPDKLHDGDHKDRDAFVSFLKDIMGECLRVLKPGGHALVWSLPRTSHWTALALEDAGFEIRDCIHHVFGQGFPKSLNISKALDKMARGAPQGGRDPQKSGKGSLPSRQALSRGGATGKAATGLTSEYDAFVPTTDESKQWEGWGTALKPAVETWWLCRKPIEAQNVASQVLQTGTGAINIDGTRIRTGDNLNGGAYVGELREKTTEWQNADRSEGKGSGFRQGLGPFQSPAGRWPSNFMLSHLHTCQQLGTTKVASQNPSYRTADKGHVRYTGGTQRGREVDKGIGYADENGQEEVPLYQCAEGCPVAALDRQSGVLTSGALPASTHKGQLGRSGTYGTGQGYTGEMDFEASTGGASRFFANFEPDKNSGQTDCHEPSYDVPFFYTGKASKADKNADLDDEGLINRHPTVKSQALMTYLVRLVTPKGGVVLDPFAGSGSTLVAAITEGMKFIGIEREEEYFTLAKTRTGKALSRAEELAAQRDLCDLISELPQE